MRARATVELLLALQAALLRLAPRGFRERFGAELLEVARRTLEDAQRSADPLAVLSLGLRHAADAALVATHLRLEDPAMRRLLVLFPIALFAAAGTGWIDTHSEEVQPAVLLLFACTATLSFLDPWHAWLWWLALGLSIPGAHLVARISGSVLPYEVGAFVWTFLALLPAGAGAFLGLGLHAWNRRRLPA